MSTVFLIAGLGADTRLYNNIDIPSGYEVIPVDWLDPNKTDTLKTYAQKLIYQYNITRGSIVIGTSLGGMLAMEIAKLIPLNKTILISSIKTSDEAPGYFRLFRNVPLFKILPGKIFSSMGFMIKPMFGNMTDGDAWLLNDMLRNTSPAFIKWAMGAVVKWDNKIIPPNVYHIHGDKDLVFPYKNVKNTELIKGGTHIMVYNMAKQVNKLLKNILKK
jgi:pimeloyl-ACP methyl ester carboxylesterase